MRLIIVSKPTGVFLFWATEKLNKIKNIGGTVNSYHPPLGEQSIHLSLYSPIPHRATSKTLHPSHMIIVYRIALLIARKKRVYDPYLLCCFDGKKLVLAFSSTYIAKGTIVCYIPSNKGDFVYWMFMLYYLELERK